MSPRHLIIVAATLALAACGPSKEEQRIDKLKHICQDSVGGTVHDLEVQYEFNIRLHYGQNGLPVCSTDLSPLQCSSGSSHCQVGFWFEPSNDPATCGQFGCFFVCDVRAVQADLKAHEALDDHEATICGARWISGQPAPPLFSLDPNWLPGQLP